MNRRTALLFAVAIVTVFASVAYVNNTTTRLRGILPPPFFQHIGAEYNNIALNIYRGNGFSDPFKIGTAPTAWMPPVLPYLMAAEYWIFNGSRAYVMYLAIAMQCVANCMLAYVVVQTGIKLRRAKSAILIVVGGFVANFHMLFQFTHDTSLLLLNNCWLYLGIVKNWNGPKSVARAGLWGAFGGYLALCSPVQGFVWAFLTAWRWSRFSVHEVRKPQAQKLAVAAVLSILVVTPWTVRNYQVFGKILPIKSNGMFELWQSQYVSESGLFDNKAALQHPWNSGSVEYRRYSDVGESVLIEQKTTIVKAAIADDVDGFANRVLNRFTSALLIYTPFDELDEYNKHVRLNAKRLGFALPVLASFALLAFGRSPVAAEVKAALAIWLLSLLPYILVSYYDRYAVPLLVVKLIVILYGLDAFANEMKSRRSSKTGSVKNT